MQAAVDSLPTQTALFGEDPYGHCGATPTRGWTEIWSTWSPQAIDDHFRGAATWGTLDKVQAGQLIQGLPPQPKGWLDLGCCLGEATAAVDRLLLDMAGGAIPHAITPEELAAWCDRMAVGLPQPFVEGLWQAHRTDQPVSEVTQAATSLNMPPWVPSKLVDSGGHSKAVAKKGRPATMKATYQALVAAGTKLLLARANQGQRMTVAAVARELHGTPVAAGMTDDNIFRRLKGKLPIKSAAATASGVSRAR